MTIARDKSFERVAVVYDEVRPGYPDALYDRIVEFGALTTDTNVLEVGVGTGKATMPLAKRGFKILGLEPGAALSTIARSSVAQFPRVTIATTTFEDWAVLPGVFGLAFSAQAFHWLNPEVRLTRFATALHPTGVLAVFGNVPSVSPGPLRDDLDVAYREMAPALSALREARNWYASAESPVMAELRASRHFHDVQFAAFDWPRWLNTSSYCELLSTYSDHSTLPPAELAALLGRLAEVVHSHGGTVSLSYRTGLFLARRSN